MVIVIFRCPVVEELDDLFVRASAEAKAAFGDGAMFAEKYVLASVLNSLPILESS